MENYLYFVSLQSYFISMWRVLIQGFFWEPRGWVDVVWNILPGKLINHVVSCYHTTQRQKLEKYFQCGRHHKIMNNLMSRIMNHYQWRREGAQGERPPPRHRKMLEKNGVIIQRSRLSEKMQNHRKIYWKIMTKSIFHRDFDEKYQNFGLFWSKRAKLCMQISYISPPDGNYWSSVD